MYGALVGRPKDWTTLLVCIHGTDGIDWNTGRIGSRRHLAENPWLVSLGCSGGAQRSCRVHLHIIQLRFYGKPLF